ncbi:MAG TPA: hypothetical protein VFR23_19415 [Jiangellaceae bacterium]|nr:hypothetical protein [Jiangellaceae bacterium]
MADAQYEITCPHADCTEALFIAWDLAYTLDPLDLRPDMVDQDVGARVAPIGSHTQTWRVECGAGHVVLLPAQSLGCPCPFDEQEGDTCPHDPDDWDQSEEWRNFRPHDAERLRDILTRIGGAS